MSELTIYRKRTLSHIYATIVAILFLLTIYDYFLRAGTRGTTYLLLASALIVLIAIQWWTRHRLTVSGQGIRLGRGSVHLWTRIAAIQVEHNGAADRSWLRLRLSLHEQKRAKEPILIQQRVDTDLSVLVQELAAFCQQQGIPFQQE